LLRTRAERPCRRGAAEKREQKAMDAIRTLPEGQNLRLDLQYALDIGANSFTELRYIYEKKKTFFLLSDFPDLLRKVILDRLPAGKS
jgi:hypothetical protein